MVKISDSPSGSPDLAWSVYENPQMADSKADLTDLELRALAEAQQAIRINPAAPPGFHAESLGEGLYRYPRLRLQLSQRAVLIYTPVEEAPPVIYKKAILESIELLGTDGRD